MTNPQVALVSKSTRHQAIVGRFGEYVVCNWLSRSGFEVTLVDHTGIDVIAFDPRSGKRLGITVKSRTRNAGAERENITIFREKNQDRAKVSAACKAFNCDPWIGVYVETEQAADLFLLSLKHFDAVYRGAKASRVHAWSMGGRNLARYAQDSDVHHIHLQFAPDHWLT